MKLILNFDTHKNPPTNTHTHGTRKIKRRKINFLLLSFFPRGLLAETKYELQALDKKLSLKEA